MVQDFGARIYDELASCLDALKVRREYFHLAAGGLFANLLDDVDEGLRGAHIVVVAVHAGDDGVLQAKLSDGVRNALRLLVVDGFGLALGYGAEAAASSA